jgi:hypothetical protein
MCRRRRGGFVGVSLALILDRLGRRGTEHGSSALVVSLGAFLAFGVAAVAHGPASSAYLFGLVTTIACTGRKAVAPTTNSPASPGRDVQLLRVALTTVHFAARCLMRF